MKTAREVAEKEHGSCDAADHDACCVECLTAIIEQARREGAEWMREQAAELVSNTFGSMRIGDVKDVLAEQIRALPVTP